MTHSPFEAPALAQMNALLPAFNFKTLIAANPHRAVYFATQRSLERDVAIKLLAPNTCLDTDFRRTFETTTHALARLNHPNLISVFDSGIVDGMLYFVMEFVPGKPLERSAKACQVEYSQALQLLNGICAGISHAHSHNLVHGTLNPSHILLNQKAEPKIGNFGLARSHPFLTEGNSGNNAESYIAPEIPSSSNAATQAADQYAIGAILYRLLTGSPHSKLAKPPSKLANCPEAIDEIWRQATHEDPAKRFASVAALQKALTSLPNKKRTGRQLVPAVAPKPAVVLQNPSAANSSQPPEPAPPLIHHPGFNWKLLRNLFIIAGLLVAVFFAWKRYKASVLKNQETHAAFEAANKKEIADAKQRALERKQAAANRSQTPPSGQPSSGETPEQSLARLRNALFTGNRSEMPVGSIQQGDSHYLLVRETLSWPEAAWFAESHGAHLAIPNRDANLSWLVKTIANSEAIWIGAARSGRDQWVLADGTLWKPAKVPDGSGLYVGADKHGLLRTGAPKLRLPFILQWHQNGSNPGTLETILTATRTSIQAGSPVFPPGTLTFGNRHFLHVVRPVTWSKAQELAETSGGHLAVPSSTTEIGHIDEMTRDIAASQGLWLGASKRQQNWLWITGEPWSSTHWRRDATPDLPDAALILLPGQGWDARNPTNPASGFIIEWSQDK